MTMSLTFSQLFMGALTIGLGTFRGTESYLSFYYETQVGHANHAASKLGADHARAANSNANNNVISSSIMGPRFAVEADNITMDVNAAIACPQWHDPHMQKICAEYMANKPRALAKLLWVRAKQEFLWGTLGKLSSTIDKVTSINALDQVRSGLGGAGDGNVRIRAEDPSMTKDIWAGDSTPTSCSLAQKDALGSEMPGHAFPLLMENLLQGLPQALVATLPQAICGAPSGGGSSSPLKLPQIPSISKDTAKQCGELEDRMYTRMHLPRPGGQDDESQQPTFSSEVAKYVKCSVRSPEKTQRGFGRHTDYSYMDSKSGQITSCTFDREKCESDKLESNTASYLHNIGLPASFSESKLGGTTRAPTDSDWNHADSMRACAYSSAEVNGTIVNISNAVRTVMSFGQSSSSNTLRERHEYQACAKWYFPDGAESEFASVTHDQQPFVAAWKYAMVAGRNGGSL
ncbi:hypothetical protein LZC95_06620 [Pendulispora brunnea]|uniref:Uncharacterized protein n=1 Tax=Pendulispora brunnea TaxID=2905690 RepID=A0ABZ2KCU5_9BACT